MSTILTHHEMLTDLYEFSMANGYYQALPHNVSALFDVFFRTVPDHGSFVIAAGLQQVIEEVKDFKFTKEDIDYLRSLNLYSDDFLNYLATMKMECKIKAMPEGTPVFPREPMLTVEGPLIQCQLLETMILNILNHQSLIATKARRITAAAEGRPVMEFGARRAQGPDAAIYGARAAVIGGCSSTSNVMAGQLFHIPVAGTMAHAWIESFPDELTAFRAWAKIYPDMAMLLVDTYDVLNSGVPNAIKVFSELKKAGHHNFGIRIDSGDIAALAVKARKMLDEAGFPEATITASNALDETVVQSLLKQDAPLSNFGIGEKLISSKSSPVLSGVYKLAALKNGESWQPKIKLSNSLEKVTLPGFKQVYRLYEHGTNEAFADVIALSDEDLADELTVYNSNPLASRRTVSLKNFYAKPLLEEVYNDGQGLVVDLPTDVMKIHQYSHERVAELPVWTKRLVNADQYPVYFTPKLAKMQEKLIQEHSN